MKKRSEITIINAKRNFHSEELSQLSSKQMSKLIKQIGIDLDQAAADLGNDSVIPLGLQGDTLLVQMKWSDECIHSIQAYLQPYIEQLVEDIQRYLFLGAFRILRNRESAQDVVQEAFMKAWIAVIKQFEEKGEVRTSGMSAWLAKIVHNTAINYRKHEQHSIFMSLLEGDQEEPEFAANQFEQPDTAVLRAESRAELLQLLNLLPSKYRKVIELRYLRELTEPEIATMLQWPLGTVKGYLNRARALLREAATIQQRQTKVVNKAKSGQVLRSPVINQRQE